MVWNRPFKAASFKTVTSCAAISPLASNSTETMEVWASPATIWPSFSASGIPGFTEASITPPATLTASGTRSPASAKRTDLATEIPAFSCASSVDAPRCGVSTTFGSPRSGEPTGGSETNTSRPAPAIKPLVSASYSASSSMIPPREQLTILRLGLAMANCFLPISPVVSAVFGMCTVMKSLRFMTSSSATSSTPICSALACVTYGS